MEENIIYRYPTHYLINNVKEVPKQISYELAKWNPACFRLENVGFYYDKDNQELRIPRGYPESSLSSTFNTYRFETYKDDSVYDKVDVGLLNAPRDYMQEHTLAFMLGATPYEATTKLSQLYIDLDTGSGKTFAAIAAFCVFKVKMVIMTPAISKVIKQWVDSVSKFTTLNTPEYLNVKGSQMCIDIINGKYDNIKFFIIPRSTILALVRRFENDWSVVTRLFNAIHPGIKVVDEAHMDFNTMVNIDCFTNVPKTYYMSSSPSRSEKTEKIIYSKVFAMVPKYGKKLKTKEQNHIIPFIINFKSTPTPEQLSAIKTRYGPSLAKYGEYLLDPEGAREEFIDAYTYALYWMQRFRRRGGKILVLCITVEFAEELKNITKSIFPYLSTGMFVGSGKGKDKELDNDIIFSTVKSMGTGSEIVNHQLTINTLTYSSDVMADQISGRIRKQENRKGIYCELVNINHKVAREHYAKREPYLRKKAKDGIILMHTVDDNDLQSLLDFFKKKYKFDKNGRILTNDGLIIVHKRSKKSSSTK